MTYDRSLDDLPLAAYGGSDMELTAEAAATPDEAPTGEPPIDEERSPEAVPERTDEPVVPPGAFAHATTAVVGPMEDEPGPSRDVPVALAALGARGVTLLRTSRPAQGAAFAGVIVVGLLLLIGGGPKPGANGAEASPSAGPVVAATREPGIATLVLTGEVEQQVSFTTSSGAGGPGAPIAVTWTDPTANSLGLAGSADRGTRSTAKTLVLQWTVMVDEKPVTFTSTDGECTLGMGIVGTRVQGTFSCKKLKSDNGKYVVGATGTYRT